MDKAFAQMQARFGKKIDFRKLNWEDKKAKSAINRLCLSKPPSSIIADSNGRVVEKFEGERDAVVMKQKLSKILGKERKNNPSRDR